MEHSSTENTETVTNQLAVPWIQAREVIHDSTYSSAFVYGRQKKAEPWLGTVAVECVVTTFKSLTSRFCLPVIVHRKIRLQPSRVGANICKGSARPR